jgi:dUTP pyrophosphatase
MDTNFLTHFFGETNHTQVMILSLFVEDDELQKIYMDAATNHNNKLRTEPHFYDAGFDVFLPKNNDTGGTKFFKNKINKVDFKVKCCAQIFTNNFTLYYTPFYTYARSSISKTPLRLANNQGIIDAGYRGPLIGMFDCLYSENNNLDCDYYTDEYSRLIQICAPGLIPIFVKIVNSFEELGPSTSRGAGGFGSTGI